MPRTLLERLFTKPAVTPARAPRGLAIYAVGDIHGRLDLLVEIHRRIVVDFNKLGLRHCVIILLGDYIDRGPDSAGVIEFLINLAATPDLQFHALKGNHEEALLLFLDQPETGVGWIQHGGAETLASYGVAPPPLKLDRGGWMATRDGLEAAMPREHIAFLKALNPAVEYGDYFFVHAGVRPGVALAQQQERDMLWIRDAFLSSSAEWGKVIVHGYTPVLAPSITSNRISLDTGAYATGVLSAVRLVDDTRKIIQVGSTMKVHREA